VICSGCAGAGQDTELHIPDVDLYDVARELARFLRDPQGGDTNFTPLFHELIAFSRSTLVGRGHAFDRVLPSEPAARPPETSVHNDMPAVSAAASSEYVPEFEDDWRCDGCDFGNPKVPWLQAVHESKLWQLTCRPTRLSC
jgi:hypothetical protein